MVCRCNGGLLSWVSGLVCELPAGLDVSDKLSDAKMPLNERRSSPVVSFGVLTMKLRICRITGGQPSPLGNHQSDKSTFHRSSSLFLRVMG